MKEFLYKKPIVFKIPVVGVVDTNSNPSGVDYIVPGNDDAMRAIRLYLGTIADIIIEKREEQKAVAKSYQEEFVEVDEQAAESETTASEADDGN